MTPLTADLGQMSMDVLCRIKAVVQGQQDSIVSGSVIVELILVDLNPQLLCDPIHGDNEASVKNGWNVVRVRSTANRGGLMMYLGNEVEC